MFKYLKSKFYSARQTAYLSELKEELEKLEVKKSNKNSDDMLIEEITKDIGMSSILLHTCEATTTDVQYHDKKTSEQKLKDAIAYLGENWVLHPNYKPKESHNFNKASQVGFSSKGSHHDKNIITW